jgi:zinc transport system substrate-binding protein
MTTRSLRVAHLRVAHPRVAPLIIAALALSACGSAGVAANGRVGGRLAIVASFYPLQFATQQVGGDFVAVTSLTRPGAEPHDIELTPRDVATVSRASLVVYEKGLQGAVDQAVESEGGNRGLDVAPAAHLDLRLASGTTDPHFWLDPQRYSEVATVIAERLARIDPAHRVDYEKNAKVFEDKLTALSGEFTSGLASCQRKDIVTSHAAFAYLAKRFGMRQIAINGISPDQEPKAGALAAVSTYAKAHGVTTIYAETLASPAIAQTVAKETGARTSTLDPLEGLTERSSGKDYFEVMRANLTALRAGQGCS